MSGTVSSAPHHQPTKSGDGVADSSPPPPPSPQTTDHPDHSHRLSQQSQQPLPPQRHAGPASSQASIQGGSGQLHGQRRHHYGEPLPPFPQPERRAYQPNEGIDWDRDRIPYSGGRSGVVLDDANYQRDLWYGYPQRPQRHGPPYDSYDTSGQHPPLSVYYEYHVHSEPSAVSGSKTSRKRKATPTEPDSTRSPDSTHQASTSSSSSSVASPVTVKPTIAAAADRNAANGVKGANSPAPASDRSLRNREACRRLREKKRNELETLRAEVARLTAENAELKRKLAEADAERVERMKTEIDYLRKLQESKEGKD
ncbi:hypothetical protein DFJ73DRAFT_767567 [Zopfochytrium polystomum]|nr:hypothetical protein DFJ73DRAFT_767567 [Zopfochytrium polystomum]